MPIPLRPNSPIQRGQGPRMIYPRSYGGMPFHGYNPHYPPHMNFPSRGRNMGNRSGGGLIAKLLGRNKQQGGFQGGFPTMDRSSANSGGGLLKSLTNPETLNGFLNNTQAVLKTAQQLGPMIQQYGPIVRNLPSLWKLYRGLKEATSEKEETVSEQQAQNEESIELVESSHQEENIKTESHSSIKDRRFVTKEQKSIPKLYI